MRELDLSVLPPPQRLLWDELSSVPAEFALYGGTAIALQLGHRQSIDFDFFARRAIAHSELVERVGFLQDAETLQSEPNTLTVRVERQGSVLVSFFGVPRLPSLRDPHLLASPTVRIADLLELAGMKAMVVQQRAEAKDYLDIHALLIKAGLSLAECLAAARFLYGARYTPEATLKSLCYYADGNLATVPMTVRRDLALAVRRCDPMNLPTLC